MDETALLRKIAAPILPSVVLHRRALVTQLQEVLALRADRQRAAARYRLVLCSAPAGYGKTILLADLVRCTSLACCWYFLDTDDGAPVAFLRTLLASLRRTFPHFGASLEALFSHTFSSSFAPAQAPYQSAIDALLAAVAIEISERFVIILCNYENINESQALNELLNYLVKKLPSHVTLIIESRGIPDLSFASLIVRDEMFSLHRDVLRFSARDIAELTRLQGLLPLSEGEAEHLATTFDGWIAGILLGTRIGDARVRLLRQDAARREQRPWPRAASLVEPGRSMLFAYVVNEILQRESATYQFLQVIATCQYVDAQICNALCHSTDAAERLARLERQGLFLTCSERESGVSYACHPVIRDLLCAQLRAREPERFTALHQQAMELWRARRDDEQAVYHALELGAYDLAASLVLDAAERVLEHGKRETVVRWLDAFPTPLQERHPHLLFLQATVALDCGQHAAAVPLLEQAEALASGPGQGAPDMLQAKIALARSKALCQAGDYHQAQALCQRTLLALPEQEQSLRAAALLRIGVCAALLGNCAAGVVYLHQALYTSPHQSPSSQAIEIHSALANSYYLTGNFLLAEHHLRVMRDACEQVQDACGRVSALVLSGLISQDQGHLAEAEASLQQALSPAHRSPYTQRGEAYALVNLGSLSLQQGKYARALACLQDGLTLARTCGNRSLVNAALASLALSYLLLGDSDSALLTVTRMEGQALHDTAGYERAWYDLTYALVLYRQQRFEEAIACLLAIEPVLQNGGLQRGIFQARLRLAACYLGQHNQKQAVHILHNVATLLAANRVYIHIVRIELQWLPDLLHLVRNHARLATLQVLSDAFVPLPPQGQEPSPAGRASLEAAPGRLTIYAFGEPTVLLNGQPIRRWRMAHAKELFFFLLENRRPVSKETILTSLWPTCDEQSARTFHNTLYYLRKLVGEACVVFDPAGYSLRLAACYEEQVWYDVQIFQQLQSEAEQALAHKNEARARDAFLKMVELYRGDYGRCFYNDWCAFRRESLRAVYLEARHQLAQMAWHAQAWNESAEHFRQMLRLDNCLEEAHYGLIRCYMRQGKRGAALRQYRLCQAVLQEELGVQPGQAIQHLYQQLTARSHAT